jgi:uncharacterized protein YeaO (DUF488 family)
MPVLNQTPCSRIKLKRAYEPPEPSDGTRILVDRLWPRGIKKPDAAIDLWLKDIAPSAELRRWFGCRPERWPEFRLRYLAELQSAQRRCRIERAAEGGGCGGLTRQHRREEGIKMRLAMVANGVASQLLGLKSRG